MRHCKKDSNDDSAGKDGANKRLDEYGVLNLAESGFFDPDLTVKDFADKVALLVLSNPWLILKAVGGC
jgi:hypothetical protein